MRRGPTSGFQRRPAPLLAGAALVAASLVACASIVGLEPEYEVSAPDAGTGATTGTGGATATSTAGPGGAGGGTGGGSDCVHTPCVVGAPLAKDCDPCVAQVCETQPYCCMMGWDPSCANLAETACALPCCGDGWCAGGGNSCATCPADCGDCSCPHSVCTAGEKLTEAGCREGCVADVCAELPQCCNYFVETTCIKKAEEICKPEPCVTAVCAVMPSCCNTAWDSDCVTAAKNECNAPCDCLHPLCQLGGALVSTCDPCVKSVCFVDAYCCSSEWDGYCLQEVEAVCGIHC